jgi:hypothetical protein
MNGREKSDSAEVAVKPANKTGMPAAEQVEPRAGTEGNAIPQSTSRTQGRADASQARDHIRVAARRNKKERFTALLHHVAPEALRDAFYAIAKNTAAGIDGITWRDTKQTSLGVARPRPAPRLRRRLPRGTRPASPLGRFADCQTSANAAYRVNLSDMRRAECVSHHRRFGPDGVGRRGNGRKGLDRDFAPVRAFLGASCFAVAFRRGGDFAAPHDWML